MIPDSTGSLQEEPPPAAEGERRRRWWQSHASRVGGGKSSRFRFLRQGRKLDEEFYDSVLEALLGGDVGLEMAEELVARLRIAARDLRIHDPQEAVRMLEQLMVQRLGERNRGIGGAALPGVIVVVGVNGNGKTTTVGKLAHLLSAQGLSVIVAAADTFRAAAREQLGVWVERSGATMVAHKDGADPGAVVFDALAAAQARHVDIVIVDTAGRLHTKGQLMAELSKIGKVIESKLGRPADEILLVLEAVTGMNAIVQAREFQKALPLTGIVLTKLDGTSKGGMVFAIEEELGIPVKLVGLGEGIEDMQFFDPAGYCQALFQDVQQEDA